MLQTIKKFFTPSKSSGQAQSKQGKNKAEKPDFAKGYDVAKQLKEMAKLGGKLVL